MALGVAVWGALALPDATSAQVGQYGAETSASREHGTVVAITLSLPVGSRHDDPGREGSAALLARTVEAAVTSALPPGAGSFNASVDRSTTTFTILALPSSWRDTWALVDRTVFEAPLVPGTVEELRAAALRRQAFEEGSPVREYEREVARSLAGPDGEWAHPVEGTQVSLRGLTTDDLERLRATHYRRGTAALAVVGPDRAIASPDSTATPQTPAPAPPAPAQEPGPAWETGDRVDLVRDVTSSWIAVAYPLPPALRPTHAELLAHVLSEQLDPTPPAPDRFSVDVTVETLPSGRVLLIEAAVLPDAAGRWEERILGAVALLAERPEPRDFFDWQRRRFRTARVLADAAPERESARLSRELLRYGATRSWETELAGLDPEVLQEAAKSLGPPHVFRFGPDLSAG